MEAQHVYHHYDGNNGPRVNVKLEKNSRGYNWEVTATGAANVDEALALVRDASEKLRAEYGE
ncbi:MAG: hypothetical protein ACOYYS_18690 [Chloroflexota bacterium]